MGPPTRVEATGAVFFMESRSFGAVYGCRIPELRRRQEMARERWDPGSFPVSNRIFVKIPLSFGQQRTQNSERPKEEKTLPPTHAGVRPRGDQNIFRPMRFLMGGIMFENRPWKSNFRGTRYSRRIGVSPRRSAVDRSWDAFPIEGHFGPSPAG